MTTLLEKGCSKCQVVQPVSEFYRCKTSADGFYSYCKTCSHRVNGRWKMDNRERANEHAARWGETPSGKASRAVSRRRWHLVNRRGVTPERFDEMVEEQDGKCFLCDRLPPGTGKGKTALHADHDHETLVARRPLCNPCNVGLGLFQDNPELLERAAKYVRSFKP